MPIDVSVAVAAVAGLSIGPVLRARIFHHSVPVEQPWRSDCPSCGYELVAPGGQGLLALLPPSGACPSCRARIGPPAGVVELLTALAFTGLALRTDGVLPLLAFCWLAATGVTLAFIDLAVHRLPDQLTVAALVGVLGLLGAAALVDGTPARIGWAALGGAGLAAVYLALVLARPAGMGLGDAKLALSLGTALGWYGWLATVLGGAAGFLLAGLVSLGLLATGRATRKTAIAHGPFMVLGTLILLMLL